MPQIDYTSKGFFRFLLFLLVVTLVTAIGVGFIAEDAGDTSGEAKVAAEQSRDLVASVVNPAATERQNIQLICFLQAVGIQRALQLNELIVDLDLPALPVASMEERCMDFEFAKYVEELKDNAVQAG